MVITHLLNHESKDLVLAAVYALAQMPQKDVVLCIVTLIRSMESFLEAAEGGRFFQNAATVIRGMGESGQRLLSLAIDEESSNRSILGC